MYNCFGSLFSFKKNDKMPQILADFFLNTVFGQIISFLSQVLLTSSVKTLCLFDNLIFNKDSISANYPKSLRSENGKIV